MFNQQEKRQSWAQQLAITTATVLFSQLGFAGVGEGPERPVRATVDGVPIYSYGSTYVLGQCPDFTFDLEFQKDNSNPIEKIKLKKSWEIEKGWTGGCPPRLPRTEMMDKYQAPLLPINLIDEDVDTYWCSRGQPVPDMEPVWIRLDLPKESWINRIVLQRRTKPYRVSWQIGPRPGVMPQGDGVPGDLEIRISQNAHRWTTVFKNERYSPQEDERTLVFEFDPKPVKQVWIVGNDCPLVDCWGYAFSLAGVEVLDIEGNNVASAKHGTGVTVSSTEATYPDDRVTLDNLWGTAWDLGLKWVRVSAWDSVLQWSYIEREKRGEYHIDPKADQAITDLAENGINVIMTLAYGNYLYSPYGPRKHEKETTDILELAGPPLTEEELDAYLKWVRLMVGHFMDRVDYYCLWNEPYQGSPYGFGDPKVYSDFVRKAVAAIKDEHPGAKIAWPTARTTGEFIEGCLAEGIAPLFDLVHADLSDPPGIKKRWHDAGFEGKFITYEWHSLATYPTPSRDAPYTAPDMVISELEKAKQVARSAAHESSHRIIMSITEWFNTYHPIWDVGLFRNTFSADPVSPTQPQPGYYVLRNMSTILSECEPANFGYHLSNSEASYQLCQYDKAGHPMMAVWVQSESKKKYTDVELDSGFVMNIASEVLPEVDEVENVATDLLFQGLKAEKVIAVDSLNGSKQDLRFTNQDGGVLVEDLLLKDYPLFIEVFPLTD